MAENKTVSGTTGDSCDRIMRSLDLSPGWSCYENMLARAKNWLRYIVPVLADKKVNLLELGSYEGRSAVWTAENLLKGHEESRLTCVDLWRGSVEPCEPRFDANVKKSSQAGKIMKVKADIIPFLKECRDSFDLIYIDGDHVAKQVVVQGGLSWMLLKPRGFLIFDDYPWRPEIQPTMKEGIDAFLSIWRDELELIWKEWEVGVRKK